MKVFNLQCSAQHAFEGWFASSEDYANQAARGLLTCPLCGDTAVHKLPSAPRLNLGASLPPETASAQPVETAPPAPPTVPALMAQPPTQALQELQAAYLQLARRIVAQTDDVGERFAEEARKMHYGDTEERGIRGQATPAQTQELLEEGIAVLPLFLPAGLNGPVH